MKEQDKAYVLYENGDFQGVYSTFEKAHKAMKKSVCSDNFCKMDDYEEVYYPDFGNWTYKTKPENWIASEFEISEEIVDWDV